MNKFNYARPILTPQRIPHEIPSAKSVKSKCAQLFAGSGGRIQSIACTVDQFTGACWDMKFQHESQSCRNHLLNNITCRPSVKLNRQTTAQRGLDGSKFRQAAQKFRFPLEEEGIEIDISALVSNPPPSSLMFVVVPWNAIHLPPYVSLDLWCRKK